MKRLFKHLFAILVPTLTYLILLRCANPVMPKGGIKDTEAPEVVSSTPQNYSVNFKGSSIQITFNEFVKLDNIQKQVLISPPPNTKPEFKLRGKTLSVRFEDKLDDSTTYSVYFGDAIVDLTESNPISGYTFVFSTGPVLDSMSIAGSIRDAFNMKYPEEAFVMLYMLNNDTVPVDSLPYLVKPFYLSRSDKEGKFNLTNLKNVPYKLFALTDMNSNFLYDMPGEKIAFIDSLIVPTYVKPTRNDTSNKPIFDSLALVANADSVLNNQLDDSIVKPETDSLMAEKNKAADAAHTLELLMFEEQDSIQRLVRAEPVTEELLRFAFRYPAKNVSVEPFETLPDSFDLLRFYTPNFDTLYWYHRKIAADSLFVRIIYDTLINDTLGLPLKPRTGLTVKKNRNDEEEAVVYLNMRNNARSRKLAPEKPFIISFDEPIVRYQMRDSNILINQQDTLINQLSFLKADANGLKYQLDAQLELGGSYMFKFPDSVFFGYSGLTNDTTQLAFKVGTAEEYGNLYLDVFLQDTSAQMIIQLMDQKENILQQQQITGSTSITYQYLPAGKYRLKAIADNNKNGRWDSGNYLKNIQPERVFYFDKEMEIRANWDFEESWEPRTK